MQKYTISPFSKYYVPFKIAKLIASVYLCFYYPYLAHQHQTYFKVS